MLNFYFLTPVPHTTSHGIYVLNVQSPVVQSVISLTSLLRVISLTVLVDSMYNILIFFQQKTAAYWRIT